MNVVCLDTQIIQWGLLKIAHDQPTKEMIPLASAFLDWLDKQKCNVIIPTLVVGELLLPVDPIEYAAALTEFSTKWMVVDYDLRAARFFAQMTHDRAVKDVRKELQRANHNVTRSHLKADMMILATARAYGADQIYSHDNKFIGICKMYLSADNFLDVQAQMKLPEGDE